MAMMVVPSMRQTSDSRQVSPTAMMAEAPDHDCALESVSQTPFRQDWDRGWAWRWGRDYFNVSDIQYPIRDQNVHVRRSTGVTSLSMFVHTPGGAKVEGSLGISQALREVERFFAVSRRWRRRSLSVMLDIMEMYRTVVRGEGQRVVNDRMRNRAAHSLPSERCRYSIPERRVDLVI